MKVKQKVMTKTRQRNNSENFKNRNWSTVMVGQFLIYYCICGS